MRAEFKFDHEGLSTIRYKEVPILGKPIYIGTLYIRRFAAEQLRTDHVIPKKIVVDVWDSLELGQKI